MADAVQFRLERMTDELDDLERRGLFTRPEISEIVQRRRDFEYRLRRPKRLKEDYMLYIDYEKKLEALRKLRKRSIIRRVKEEVQEEGARDGGEEKRKRKRKKWKKSISDFSCVRRILDIYRMAVTRYKGDLSIWFQYLEFCREERRQGRMKKVLAQAIRFHPNIPGLWIYAAAWEFNQNFNVAAARALMLSGLRVCPTSEDLWIEYLRMELTYLSKLKARKLALGEGAKTKDERETEDWKEENNDLFMRLDDGNEKSADQKDALDSMEELFWVQGSKTLQTIYLGAMESIPSSMELRKRFLAVLDDVNLGKSEELREEMLEGLRKDFFRDEDYWDWFARRQVGNIKLIKDLNKEAFLLILNKVVKDYEEALDVLPSTKMFSLYTKFWRDVMETRREDPLLSSESPLAIDCTSRVLKVYERAERCGCLNQDLACEYVSFHLQTGRLQEARSLAERLCNGKLSEVANLWDMRISIELKCVMDKSDAFKDNMQSVFELLRSAFNKLPISEVECLWLKAVKLFLNDKKNFKRLTDILILSLGKDDNQSGYMVASSVVNCVLQRYGITRARSTYKLFLDFPNPSLPFFKHCIDLESNLASLGDADGVANARKLFELALHIYGQNKDLWRDYYNSELRVTKSSTKSHSIVYQCSDPRCLSAMPSPGHEKHDQ